jgi:hypothetical protein
MKRAKEALESQRRAFQECPIPPHVELVGWGKTIQRANPMRELTQEAYGIWPLSEAIIRELAPHHLPSAKPDAPGWVDSALEGVVYTLGLIEQQADIEELVGPRGPRLNAASLHPLVWRAAASIWDASPRHSVGNVALKVNKLLQDKLGVTDISESDLANQAFSDKDSAPGRPRLRFPGERSKTWASRMNGARGLGQACFQGVRNVASHDEAANWSEEEALEYLAMFSVLARWIDECDVERSE